MPDKEEKEDYFQIGQYVTNLASGYTWFLNDQKEADVCNKGKENGKTNIDHKDCMICKNDIATFFYNGQYYCDTCIQKKLKLKNFDK